LPNCAVYQLAMTQYIEIGPGETTQVPHRDDARASDAATTEELWRKIRETPSG